MKDFIKWLGVNEKIAKVVVWMFIIMVFLILINTLLRSVGLPHYAITYENLVKIKSTESIETIVSFIICFLNYFAVTLLVFRVNKIKKLIPYSIIYVIINWIIANFFGYIATQIYVFLFFAIFCYCFSNKKPKYIIYSILALILDASIQGVWYSVKLKFIDYNTLNVLTKSILTLDYFIIIGIIILVKEIYLKKRGEKGNVRRRSI